MTTKELWNINCLDADHYCYRYEINKFDSDGNYTIVALAKHLDDARLIAVAPKLMQISESLAEKPALQHDAFWTHMERDDLSTNARLVKIVLTLFSGPDAYLPLRKISEKTGLAESTIRRALRELEAKEHLKTRHTEGYANAYTILLHEDED